MLNANLLKGSFGLPVDSIAKGYHIDSILSMKKHTRNDGQNTATKITSPSAGVERTISFLHEHST
jgi:hypothetical protein